MKKSYKLFICALIITVVLALGGGTALAADYQHCAEALQAMGLLQSSVNGFELDRTATRAEAAVMLVSLLGAEQEALQGAFSHPFTDVPQQVSPYVGYMYEKGLTKGVDADSFNPQGACDLRMYSTFVLRALGYTEAAGDFTYEDAAAKAMKLGVADIMNASGNFQRDNMAAISYTALFAPAKGTDNTLLEQLIEQGAIKTEAAIPYLELYNTYALIQESNAKLADQGEKPLEMQLDMVMKMDMGEMGSADINLSSLLQIDASAVSGKTSVEEIMAALNKLKFAMTNKLALTGSDISEEQMNFIFDLYLQDNILYIDNNLGEVMEDETVPTHLKVDIDTLLALMQMSGMDLSEMMKSMESIAAASWMPDDPYTVFYGISMIKNLNVENLPDGGRHISMNFINIPNDMMNSITNTVYGGMPAIMDVMAQVNMDCQIGDCSYTLDKDGNITAVSVAASVQQTMFVGTEMAATSHTDFQMSYEVTKTGAEVTISQPAQDVEYVDLLEMLMPQDN